jgi:hypothetical protein
MKSMLRSISLTKLFTTKIRPDAGGEQVLLCKVQKNTMYFLIPKCRENTIFTKSRRR